MDTNANIHRQIGITSWLGILALGGLAGCVDGSLQSNASSAQGDMANIKRSDAGHPVRSDAVTQGDRTTQPDSAMPDSVMLDSSLPDSSMPDSSMPDSAHSRADTALSPDQRPPHKGGPLPIIPGDEVGKYGMTTPAGSGRHLSPPKTTIYKVQSLADYHPKDDTPVKGTLRYGVEMIDEPRTIIFEVAGQIWLRTQLVVNSSYLTIAGQTAPPPGITLHNHGLTIASGTKDVLIQHIRSRVGTNYYDLEGCNGRGTCVKGGSCLAIKTKAPVPERIVIDHCSFQWGVDMTVSNGGDYITIQNSIVAEPLHNKRHPDGLPHGKGICWFSYTGAANTHDDDDPKKKRFIGAYKNLSAGNLFTRVPDRSPRVLAGKVALIGNYVYDVGYTGAIGQGWPGADSINAFNSTDGVNITSVNKGTIQTIWRANIFEGVAKDKWQNYRGLCFREDRAKPWGGNSEGFFVSYADIARSKYAWVPKTKHWIGKDNLFTNFKPAYHDTLPDRFSTPDMAGNVSSKQTLSPDPNRPDKAYVIEFAEGDNPRIRERMAYEGHDPLPFSMDGISVPDYRTVRKSVLDNVGAFNGMRDAIDARVVNDVRNKVAHGTHITVQDEVATKDWKVPSFSWTNKKMTGKYPVVKEVRRKLSVPRDPHELQPSGYTKLEQWLHGYLQKVQ
jgi:hypothetical protein